MVYVQNWITTIYEEWSWIQYQTGTHPKKAVWYEMPSQWFLIFLFQNAVLSSAPFIANWIFLMIYSKFLDFLQYKQILQKVEIKSKARYIFTYKFLIYYTLFLIKVKSWIWLEPKYSLMLENYLLHYIHC